MPTFDEIKDSLLSKLHEIAMEPGSPVTFGEDFILSLLPNIGPGIIHAAINDLEYDSVIDRATLVPKTYRITSLGIKHVEQLSQPTTNSPQNDARGPFSAFKDSLLIALARKENSDGDGFYYLEQVADESGLSYGDGWIRKAAYSFRDFGLIKDSFTSSGLGAQLTAKGLEAAEALIAGLKQNSIPQLSSSTIPASNRVVSLDHNGDPYKEAIRALETVLQEFRKDHKSSANHFDIEDRVLFKVLEAGRTLLDETEVYLETAENYLIRPLRRIIERYDQAIVGILIVEHGSEMLTAAKTALDAVLKLLGLG